MTAPRTDRPDLPIDDRDEPLTGDDRQEAPGTQPQEAPVDLPGPEDRTDLDRMLADDIDDLDPGDGE